MFCINCFSPSTSVTNSRPNKKHPLIWRRRYCKQCGVTFTTHERPALTENQKINTLKGMVDFNLGKLIISIARAFTHSSKDAQYASYWLAQTIEGELSTQRQSITTNDIEAITHQVLKRFDELAAVQYAAQHHMITLVKRRGRPSFAWHEQPTDESPSR